MTVLGRLFWSQYLLSGGGVQATLRTVTVGAGHRHRLIGSRRRWEGWGWAVALLSLEW